MTYQSFRSLQSKMECLQLVANHPWFGSQSLDSSAKADLDSICSTVFHNSDRIVRGTGSSFKNISLLCLDRLGLSSVKSAISISSCVVILQVLQEAMVSLKKVFLDPISKMMPCATIFSFKTRQEGK